MLVNKFEWIVYVKCKLCDLETTQKYRLKGSRSKQDIVVSKCHYCSIHYCDVIDYNYKESDENIVDYYENARQYIESRQHKIFSFVSDKFKKKSGAFLDVGSGIGYSLKVAQELGWQAFGIEPNTTLESYSKHILKLNTVNGYLSKDTVSIINEVLPEGYADYILIDNVLEHIPEPLEFFQNVLSLLKPGGLLLIAIPPVDWFRLGLASISSIRQNSSSAQFNLFYDPEQHVNYFSRKAMKVLTKKVGGCQLTDSRFHHSTLLNNRMARMLRFETGYYFVIKE